MLAKLSMIFFYSDTIWGDTSPNEVLSKPALFKGTFTVSGRPADTFLDTQVSIHYCRIRVFFCF